MRRRIWRGWILCLCACLLLCGAASGTGSTPPDAVSRGAFADALYDAHVAHGGAPVVSEGSSAPFRDVGSWSPYFEALCWAKASGIAGGYAGGAFRPVAPEGLTMELQQCTTTGAVVVLQNAAEETFSYGADYGLYRQVNGGWYQMNKEMDTIAIAYELAPGESRKLTLSWGELDWGGVLPAGTYCVAQGGLLGEQQVTVSVTFAIK